MGVVGRPGGPQVGRPEVTGGAAPTRDSGWMSLFVGAFNRSKNPMALLDERRRYVEVNGAFLHLLGYRRKELIGHPVSESVVGGPILSEAEWRTYLRQKQFTASGNLRRKDGSQVMVEFAAHPARVTGRPLVLFVALATNRRGRQRPSAPVDSSRSMPLSDRELQIVRLIASGFSGPEIAQELHVAHNTVRTHVRNATTKLDARSRAHLVARVLGEGLYWTDQP